MGTHWGTETEAEGGARKFGLLFRNKNFRNLCLTSGLASAPTVKQKQRKKPWRHDFAQAHRLVGSLELFLGHTWRTWLMIGRKLSSQRWRSFQLIAVSSHLQKNKTSVQNTYKKIQDPSFKNGWFPRHQDLIGLQFPSEQFPIHWRLASRHALLDILKPDKFFCFFLAK